MYFQGGRIVTKLLPFNVEYINIFDIYKLTNQATMSVAGIRRTITLRTCDLKDNMKPRYSDTGSMIYSNQYKYDVHMTHMMHYAFICTTSSHEISSNELILM